MSKRLSSAEIYTLLVQGGFSPDKARIMTAIAQAESTGKPDAIGDVDLQNSKWGPSVGLFQVRTLKNDTGRGTERDIEHLRGDVVAQVKAALKISDHGRNLEPWSTYNSGSYRKFLDHPLPDHVPAATETSDQPALFAIDQGRKPIAVADKDRDGLIDRFEVLLGTDPTKADTDHDGRSDADETSVDHTDPLAADTDHDGVSDSDEHTRHTNAGHAALPAAAVKAGFGGQDTLDSDRDGLSDGYERRHGTNARRKDSDHDGLDDGAEVSGHTDPTTVDSDKDGLSDGFSVRHDLLPEAQDAPPIDLIADGTDLDSH